MKFLFEVIFFIICFASVVYAMHKYRFSIFPFCGYVASDAWGNSVIFVILDAAGTFPASLTQWTGSTGNIHFYHNLAEGTTEDNMTASIEKPRTNDKKVFQVIPTYDGSLKANFYGRSELDVTFFTVGCKAALAAGQKVLAIVDMGYENAKYIEVIHIGDAVPQRTGKDGDLKASSMEFVPTPPFSAFTLSAANITAIEAVSAANYVVHTAGPKTIAAGDTEVLVYT